MAADAADILACWKNDAPSVDTLAAVCDELVSIARERHGESCADALSRASRPDNDEAWRIAQSPDAAGLEEDERKAWLWVAASCGHVEAAKQLAVMLQMEAVRLNDFQPESRRLLDLAESWFVSLRRDDPGSLRPEEDPVDIDLFDDEAAVAEAVELPSRDGRVVLDFIGDAASREGADLSRRYADIVGKRLPFAGSLPAPGQVEASVLGRWPWASDAASALETHFAVLRASAGPVRLPPLLLVGPPGSGKSSIARHACELVGLKVLVMPCGGTADAGGLGAVTRGWSTARPSAIASAMQQFRCANPAFVLDEIEKSSAVGSQNGSVQATLLQIVGSDSYVDTCLMAPVDISVSTFLATANSLAPLDPALRDRFQIVRVDAPREKDIPVLLRNVRADFSRKFGLPEYAMPHLSHDDAELLRRWFKKQPSARAFAMLYERIMRDIIRERERAPQSAPLH